MSQKNPKQPTSQLIFQSAENTTTNQLNNLLQIGSFALHALMRPGLPGAEASPAEFPGEAQIAAELTFINTCERMDAMLKDESRWNLESQQKLQAKFEAAHALNIDYLTAQKEAAELFNKPHFRFKPSIHRLRDGRFLALLGNVEDLDNAIVGIGGSAAEAMQRFDETFENGVPANAVEYLAQREKALEEGRVPEPYPTTEKINESEKQMDPGGNPPAQKPARVRKNKSGNS